MRGRLKYGVPAAAGLLAGGYALSQGEDPGSAILAGVGGTLGGAAGLLGARALAGRYAKDVAGLVNTGKEAAVRNLTSASQNIYPPLKTSVRTVSPAEAAQAEKINRLRSQMAGESKRAALLGGMAGAIQGLPQATEAGMYSGLKKGFGAIAAPAGALAAGLGGVALGAIPGSIGVPGFQQGMAIDPEDPRVSSNTPGAKYSVSPYASTQYM
jgi:hypothetical protein